MTDRIFNVDFNFLENCNYNASAITKDINMPLQKPTVTVQQIGTEKYYGDTLTFEAHIAYESQTITYGVVNFYYINSDDYQTVRHQINTEPIDVDQRGNACISFIPYRSCKVIAEYDGNPYFDVAEGNEEIILYPIPTEIKFKNSPTYFVNPEDSIKLDVIVNDIRNPETPIPIDYGLVTFMHYDVFDINNPRDGQEHVIGNPTYLIDGKSSINYSPVQKPWESDNIYNIELIRAVYNYQNNLYGVDWRKYYHMDSTYVAIALLKPNNININIIKMDNDGDHEMIVEEGVFVGTNEDNIVLTFTITDDNNDEICFEEDAKLRVYIQGYDNDNEIIPRYAQYSVDRQRFECPINNLQSGTYYAYGVAIDNNNKYLGDNNLVIITDEEGNEPQNITNVDGKNIKNKIYLQSSESQHIYFQIKAEEKAYEIAFTNEEEYVILERQQPLSITARLTAPNDPDFNNIIRGETCYFNCATLNQTYSSIIQEDNDGLYATFNIIEEIDNNGHTEYQYNIPLNLENSHDYIFYAYINTTIKDLKKYAMHYSEPLIIKVRHNPKLILSVVPINSTYPGKIKYTLIGENIYQETIPITLTVDDENPIELSLSQEENIAIGYIGNLLPMASPGHIIKASTPYYNNLSVETPTQEITKGTLSFDLNSYSNDIITSRNTNVIFGVTESNGNDIKDQEVFNKNSQEIVSNLDILFSKDNASSTTINMSEQMTDTYLNLISNVNLCDDGIWTIDIRYDGNELYNANSSEMTINAIRYTPFFQYRRNSYQLFCQITNNENVHNEERVLIVATFMHNNEDYFRLIGITNTDGSCVLEIPEDISTMEWNNIYSDFTIEVNPHLNVFSAPFESFFDDNRDYIVCSSEDIEALYEQYQDNYELCLFTGYEESIDTNNINNINDIEEEYGPILA